LSIRDSVRLIINDSDMLSISDSDKLIISDNDRLIINDCFSDRLCLHLYFSEEGRFKERGLYRPSIWSWRIHGGIDSFELVLIKLGGCSLLQ
jgi:hypothetical protein